MSISDYCQKNPSRVRPDETLRVAAKRMDEDGVGCLVVVNDEQRPVGILTDRDVVMRGLRRRRDLDATPVSEIMTTDVTTVPEFIERQIAIRRLRAEGIRRIPVVDDESRLVGIFSIDDALQSFAACAEAAAAVALVQSSEDTAEKGA